MAMGITGTENERIGERVIGMATDEDQDEECEEEVAASALSDVEKLRLFAKAAAEEPVTVSEQGRDELLKLADDVDRLRKKEAEELQKFFVESMAGDCGEPANNATQSSQQKQPSSPAGQQSTSPAGQDAFASQLGQNRPQLPITADYLIRRLQAKRTPSPTVHNELDHYYREFHKGTDMISLTFGPTGGEDGPFWLVTLQIEFRGSKSPPAKWQVGVMRWIRDVEILMTGLQIEPPKPVFELPAGGEAAALATSLPAGYEVVIDDF